MDILTSKTLLESLKERENHEAWSQFYRLYSPIIFGIARKFGFERADSEDILQEAMCSLVVSIPKFEYGKKTGRFSSYLYVIVRSIISKRFKIRRIETLPIDKELSDRREHPTTDAESLDFFEELEHRRKENVKRIALTRVKQHLEDLTWKSFKAFVLEGNKSAEEVAEELGIKDRNSIYQHKNRVISLLKAEVKRLEQEIGDIEETKDWDNHEFEDGKLSTLNFEPEKPSPDVSKRIQVIRKALMNQGPLDTKRAKILVITPGNNWWEDLGNEFYVGRRKDNNLQINSNFLSEKHCVITQINDRWEATDLNSTNGTSINGKPISNRILHSGDIIQLGNIMLLFSQTNTDIDLGL